METAIYTPQQCPAVTVVQTSGDVDFCAAGCDRVFRVLHGLVEGGDHFLVFDLSRSQRVDDRALAEMVGVLAWARLSGGDAVFVAQSPQLLDRLHTIGITNLTPVVQHIDEAISHLARKVRKPNERN